MFDGKGQGIDTAKLAVRPAPDEFFDRAHRFGLCRLSQSIEQRVGFIGAIHNRIILITLAVVVAAGLGRFISLLSRFGKTAHRAVATTVSALLTRSSENGKQVTDAPNILLRTSRASCNPR